MPFLFPKDEIRLILSGATTSSILAGPCTMRKGRTYSVKVQLPPETDKFGRETGPAVVKPSPLKLRVTAKPEPVEGGWLVRFEVNRDDPVRLLAAGSPGYDPKRLEDREENNIGDRGYTTTPVRAVQDAGEAVDDYTLARFARDAWDNHREYREAQKDARSTHTWRTTRKQLKRGDVEGPR